MLAQLAPVVETEFRIHRKMSDAGQDQHVVWEHECDRVSMSFEEFDRWLRGDLDQAHPASAFPCNDFWCVRRFHQ
jgi:hypothetical protein